MSDRLTHATNTRAKFNIAFKSEWCKSCGICINICPKQVFTEDREGKPVILDRSACIGCNLCEQLCPDLALEIRDAGQADDGMAEGGLR